MTSISGTTSTTSSTYTSPAAAAGKAAKLLLTSTNMTNILAMKSSAKTAPTASQVTSTLWSIINPNNASTIKLSNVTTAVKAAGGTSSDAYNLWTQMNPGAAATLTEKQFSNSTFVKNAISTNLVTVQKNVSDALANNPLKAEKTIQFLMSSPSVIKSLASQSTRWTPPTSGQVLSTLWGLFNVNSTKVITKSDVKAGVIAEGGTPAQANALWAKLDPHNTGAVGAVQFANNNYLKDAIQVNLATTQANVSNAQLINNNQSNTVLDSFTKGGKDVLSQAATGYNGSAVGTGNNFNYLNLFV